MSGFDDLQVGWKDKMFRVPPEKCLSLLAKLEMILAPHGGATDVMFKLSNPQTVHLTVMARAYAVAIRDAGCSVTDDEVYLSLAGNVMAGGNKGYEAILTLSQGLMFMFFPDWIKDEDLAGDDAGKDQGQVDGTPLKKDTSEPSMTHSLEGDLSAPQNSGT